MAIFKQLMLENALSSAPAKRDHEHHERHIEANASNKLNS